MKKEFRKSEKPKNTYREPPKQKIANNTVFRKHFFDTDKFWYYYTEVRNNKH